RTDYEDNAFAFLEVYQLPRSNPSGRFPCLSSSLCIDRVQEMQYLLPRKEAVETRGRERLECSALMELWQFSILWSCHFPTTSESEPRTWAETDKWVIPSK